MNTTLFFLFFVKRQANVKLRKNKLSSQLFWWAKIFEYPKKPLLDCFNLRLVLFNENSVLPARLLRKFLVSDLNLKTEENLLIVYFPSAAATVRNGKPRQNRRMRTRRPQSAISRHLDIPIQNKCYRNKDTWKQDRKKVPSPLSPCESTRWQLSTPSPACTRWCQPRIKPHSGRTHSR